MKTLPKISIITPSFNSARYIEQCIKSVLEQNYPNFEHIIIDGGSNDGTIEILKKYKHLKWISEKDEGQSDALNKGFKLVTGDIIGWLNADDVYLTNTFIKVTNILGDQSIKGVYANCYFSDDNLNIKRELKSHKPIKWLSLFHCFIPSTTFFLKREIIDNGILIDKSKHITMDKDFFARILFAGYKLKYVNDYWAIFRWHSNNKSIDTKIVRRKRYKEGLELFNLLSPFKLPFNKFGLFLYMFLNNFLLLYRIYLKYLRKD